MVAPTGDADHLKGSRIKYERNDEAAPLVYRLSDKASPGSYALRDKS